MDCFIVRYFLIKLIRVLDRAVFYTDCTAGAFALVNIFGLFIQPYLEVPCFPRYTVNFSIGEDFYILMPADLDQLWREYSHGAVIGGKGLVQLGHMAPDAGRFFHQVNFKAGGGKIERGLNTADPSANNHYVSKITAYTAFTKLLYLFF
jgi:hypothetical protein